MAGTTISEDLTTISAPYMDSDLDQGYPYGEIVRIFDITILALMIILGIIGNFAVVLAYSTSKNLRTPADIFVISMVVADCLICLQYCPMLASVINRGNVLDYYWCQAFGINVIIGAVGSIYSLTMVSVIRMMHICYTSIYQRYFTKKHCMIYVMLTWLLVIVVSLPPALGWGRVGYVASSVHCGLVYKYELGYVLYLFILVEGSAIVVTFLCYANIFKTIRASANQLAQHSKNEDSEQSRRAKNRQRQAFCSFVISALFVILWVPFIVSTLWDHANNLPFTLIKIATWTGFANSAVNGLVYITINKHYRNACLKFIPCAKKKVAPASTSHGSTAVTRATKIGWKK